MIESSAETIAIAYNAERLSCTCPALHREKAEFQRFTASAKRHASE